MKKTKIFKIIISILIAITLLTIFTQNALALNFDISNKFDGQKDKGNATNTITEIIGKGINVIQVVGMGVAIIMLIVIGIKWIGASPSSKAQIAKTARYYIMGAIFIFTAMGLLQIVKNFTNKSIVKQIS